MELPKGIEKILNKQFEMIESNNSFEDITDEGLIEINKKLKNWYDIFKFKNYEQYLEWRNEAEFIINNKGYKFDEIDSLYGFTYSYKDEEIKKGDQLSLL